MAFIDNPRRGPQLYVRREDGTLHPAEDEQVIGAANYIRFRRLWRKQQRVTVLSSQFLRHLQGVKP